jgi:hypothetical protein
MAPCLAAVLQPWLPPRDRPTATHTAFVAVFTGDTVLVDSNAVLVDSNAVLVIARQLIRSTRAVLRIFHRYRGEISSWTLWRKTSRARSAHRRALVQGAAVGSEGDCLAGIRRRRVFPANSLIHIRSPIAARPEDEPLASARRSVAKRARRSPGLSRYAVSRAQLLLGRLRSSLRRCL